MIFVYLRNGRRVDRADAVSVVHRSQVTFFDSEGQIVRQMPPDEAIAYSRVLYEEDKIAAPEHPSGVFRMPVSFETDSLMLRRRRHRRSKRAPGEPDTSRRTPGGHNGVPAAGSTNGAPK